MSEPTSDELRAVVNRLLERFGARNKIRDSADMAARASRRLGHPVTRDAVEAILSDYAAQGKLTLGQATGSDALTVQRMDEAFVAELAARPLAGKLPDLHARSSSASPRSEP